MKDFSSRLKLIRNSLGMTREGFASFSGFPEITIRSWEYKNVPPSNKSIQRLVESLTKNNIKISREWLLEGSGVNPFHDEKIDMEAPSSKDMFVSKNPHGIFFTIPDQKTLPYFKNGDEVGAIPSKSFDHLDLVAIIKNDTKDVFEIRQIFKCIDNNIILMPLSIFSPAPIIFNEKKHLIYKIVFKKTADQVQSEQ